MKRSIFKIAAITIVIFFALFTVILWMASNQLLYPSFKGIPKSFTDCNPESEKVWGKGCGNIRDTRQFKFNEITISSTNGYQLPGWLIKSDKNGCGSAKGVIILVHGGGGDRREETNYIPFFLKQHLDVLTFDMGCSGEAPCPIRGLTYGTRESRDVLSVYLYLDGRYDKIYAMGTSMGASAVLIAVPEMPKLTAVIAENPMATFRKFIAETPASQSAPSWFLNAMIKLTMLRGGFDDLQNAETSLKLVHNIPILFIQSKKDRIIPFESTEKLATVYRGPKKVWLAEKGDHAAIWNADPALYEQQIAIFLNSVKDNEKNVKSLNKNF
jgi:pimeloyl-ACP methyl ester carboxylesterase